MSGSLKAGFSQFGAGANRAAADHCQSAPVPREASAFADNGFALKKWQPTSSRANAVVDSQIMQTGGVVADPGRTAMLPMPAPPLSRGVQEARPAVQSPSNLAPAEIRAEGKEVIEKCKSPQELKSIKDIHVDIGIKPEDLSGAKRLPPECTFGNEPVVPRRWRRTTFAWTAAATWHKPIYFEDEQLERYGHTFGPITQTAVSAVKFFGTVPLVPYYMGVYPPNECIYDLGTYRPGNCAPYYFDPFPLSVRGAVNELSLGILPAL